MSAMETDILADLLRAKQACLTQLSEMGRRQLVLIENEEMTMLLDLLGVKQRVIAQLQRVERLLDPFRHDDPEKRQWRSPELRASCAERIAACDKLLSEVLAQEKSCETNMIRRRDDAAAKLRGVHFADQARAAYAPVSSDASGELDLLSEA